MRVLAVVLFTSLCLYGCRGSSAPTIRGLDGQSAEQYFDLDGGNLTLPFGKAGDPVSTRDDWTRLVDEERQSGLSGLSPDRRRALIAGSMKAFLVTVHEARYSATLARGGSGTLTDVYEPNPSGLYTVVVRRGTQAHAILFPWPGAPTPFKDAREEERWFVNSGSPQTEDHWTLLDGTWSCSVVDARGDAKEFEALIFAELSAVIDGRVAPTGQVRGRSAVAIDSTFLGREVRVWLDDATLWPIRIEFARQNEEPKAFVTLEEINGELAVPTPSTTASKRC